MPGSPAGQPEDGAILDELELGSGATLVVESGVSRIAASWGTAKGARDSVPPGEETDTGPLKPGIPVSLGEPKLGTRCRGMYDAEWRFLCRARRSARTNLRSQPSTSHLKISLGESRKLLLATRCQF